MQQKQDMRSYIIPTLKQNPETIIIHKGASDLKSEEILRRQSNEENVKPKIFVLLTTEIFLQSKNVDYIFVNYI